jgi:hypothetical protein
MSKIRKEWLPPMTISPQDKALAEFISIWGDNLSTPEDTQEHQEKLLDMIFPTSERGNYGITGVRGYTGVQGITGVRGSTGIDMSKYQESCQGITGPPIVFPNGRDTVSSLDILDVLRSSTSDQILKARKLLEEASMAAKAVKDAPAIEEPVLYLDDLLTVLFKEVMDPQYIRRIGRKIAS